jgi:hypothetical protein
MWFALKPRQSFYTEFMREEVKLTVVLLSYMKLVALFIWQIFVVNFSYECNQFSRPPTRAVEYKR